MSQPVPYDLVAGETFLLEVRVLDTDGAPVDVSLATKSITCGDGISSGDFTFLSGSEAGCFLVKSDGSRTAVWPLGTTPLRVWFDNGPSSDVEDEVVVELLLSVRAAL